MLHHYNHPEPFYTESGGRIGLQIAYATYGTLNRDRSNVVWVCHALTANAEVVEWWPGLVGEGCAINPAEHFIVCANILGSPYGSASPQSIAEDGKAYGMDFPPITIRDMVEAHILLRKHLGIEKIALLAGGSMGGYQVLEWALMEPGLPQRLFLIATAAAESAWGIAIHEAQRMSIEADPTWKDHAPGAGAAGLKAARAIGMLTYRNAALFNAHHTEVNGDKIDGFHAASYQRYQGEKLVRRFDAKCYWHLTKAMDTHSVARGRKETIEAVLQSVHQPSLVMGIGSDLLCPLEEQRFLAAHLRASRFVEIDSHYGHDGFLKEAPQIGEVLRDWWEATAANL